MKAAEAKLLGFLQKSSQPTIAIYQRIFAAYAPTTEQSSGVYSINDHPYLLGPAVRPAFEEFTDATNVGSRGNGDVQVAFKSFDELPYVMGLVRQSYERQMGDGGQS